jgi:hypothetical protein
VLAAGSFDQALGFSQITSRGLPGRCARHVRADIQANDCCSLLREPDRVITSLATGDTCDEDDLAGKPRRHTGTLWAASVARLNWTIR